MFLSADKERGHFRPSWACITLNAQYNCPLSKLSHSAKRSILTGSHPRPMCSLRGALEGAAHPAPGHTLQGPRAGELPTGPGGVGGVTGRVGVPPPQAPTGRQPASEPDRKQEKTTRAAWKSPPGPMPECDSVGLAGQLPSRPSAGTQGAGPQEAAQPLHRHGHGSPSGLFTALQMPSQSRRDRVVPT